MNGWSCTSASPPPICFSLLLHNCWNVAKFKKSSDAILCIRCTCEWMITVAVCIARSESDDTRGRTRGEVKGKYANGVGSQQSCTVSEDGLSSITTADAHTSAASSRLNWQPRRFKWTRPFRWKTKSGFCACAITFRTSYTAIVGRLVRMMQRMWYCKCRFRRVRQNCEKRLLASSCLSVSLSVSVCLSVCLSSCPQGTIRLSLRFMKLDIYLLL